MEVAYLEVSLERISPNIRTIFEIESIEDLSSSIRREGLREPIHISLKGDTFRIIDGEKRWRACRRLGMSRVKAVVVETVPADGEALW